MNYQLRQPVKTMDTMLVLRGHLLRVRDRAVLRHAEGAATHAAQSITNINVLVKNSEAALANISDVHSDIADILRRQKVSQEAKVDFQRTTLCSTSIAVSALSRPEWSVELPEWLVDIEVTAATPN